MNTKFDDIRPYVNTEIPDAMQRIANHPALPLLASYVFPEKPLEEVKALLLSFRSINDFQHGVMHRVNEQIINKSITEFSYGGLEHLKQGTPYLFVSNHRDIMLDASLLQNVLADNGLETSQITFGANLMMHDLVIDIGKSNKMFRVERPGGSIKDFYNRLLHLSEYIRYVICEKKESVWIAQRNGRTKDGNDKTDQGVIKMFSMSETKDNVASIANLNIVPVAVSYEWESCDLLKAIELYESLNVKYMKKPGEDLNSILTGILQPKGRVHFQCCEPIHTEELTPFADCVSTEYHRQVAQLIDERILAAYKLWPTNYIAHDMLSGSRQYSDHYTEAEYKAFEEHMKPLEQYECNQSVLRNIFLHIYANPVNNKI